MRFLLFFYILIIFTLFDKTIGIYEVYKENLEKQDDKLEFCIDKGFFFYFLIIFKLN